MKILVCIKQVPDTTDIKWTENNTIQREGVESIINPCDVYALETAIKIKKQFDSVNITAITMGPLQAESVLKKAIAIGCDNGILISDKKFSGADTYATAKTISSAIKSHLNDYDLILCGQYAIDGDTAQTGPEIAAKLDIPQVTFVKEFNMIDEKSAFAIRETDEGIEKVKIELPTLVCVLKGNYEPSRPTINGIIKANNTDIKIFTLEDINLTPDDVGIKGSPTFVSKAFRPNRNRGECKFLDCDSLTEKLKEYINE